ncbi:MAG: Hint domain-containing protein [Pseudomonadota bacterium]
MGTPTVSLTVNDHFTSIDGPSDLFSNVVVAPATGSLLGSITVSTGVAGDMISIDLSSSSTFTLIDNNDGTGAIQASISGFTFDSFQVTGLGTESLTIAFDSGSGSFTFPLSFANTFLDATTFDTTAPVGARTATVTVTEFSPADSSGPQPFAFDVASVPPCFVAGTWIVTADGPRPVEALRPGDLIATRDAGLQPLRWVGGRRVAARGALAPIEISAGALGNRDAVRVSPNHRMLIADVQAELLFGVPEVLVAAKHLCGGRAIRALEGGEVTYFHLLFDQHQIVTANGVASESFHPGQIGLDAFGAEARAEIYGLFPELAQTEAAYGRTARMSLSTGQAEVLCAANGLRRVA